MRRSMSLGNRPDFVRPLGFFTFPLLSTGARKLSVAGQPVFELHAGTRGRLPRRMTIRRVNMTARPERVGRNRIRIKRMLLGDNGEEKRDVFKQRPQGSAKMAELYERTEFRLV